MQDGLYKNKYRIASTRLPGWNYAWLGRYFVTICTKDRELYFGDVIDGQMILNEIGRSADQYWLEIPDHFPFTQLGAHIVMPNHVHGTIIITDHDVETQYLASQDIASNKSDNRLVETQDFALQNDDYKNKFGPQSKNLSSIIRGFKAGVKKWATLSGIDFLWQARFYDHIIRNDKSYEKIQAYILNNPYNWQQDKNNPANAWM